MQWRFPYGASVGRQLDRDAGVGTLRPVRHDARDARLDRVERAEERRAHAVGDLQGTAHDGRLPERADDHDAVRALRLRRAVRRCGRRDRVAEGPRRRHEAEAGVPRGRRHPGERAHELGPGRARPRTAGHRDRPATSGPAPTSGPTDIDLALLYDGFSFNCLSWLEALGFCGEGEAKDFLDGGKNIALDGVLPLNTHGGQLSSGRLHGFGFVHEAVTQLRGDAGERQVDGRRDRGREQRRRCTGRRLPLHRRALTERRRRVHVSAEEWLLIATAVAFGRDGPGGGRLRREPARRPLGGTGGSGRAPRRNGAPEPPDGRRDGDQRARPRRPAGQRLPPARTAPGDRPGCDRSSRWSRARCSRR